MKNPSWPANLFEPTAISRRSDRVLPSVSPSICSMISRSCPAPRSALVAVGMDVPRLGRTLRIVQSAMNDLRLPASRSQDDHRDLAANAFLIGSKTWRELYQPCPEFGTLLLARNLSFDVNALPAHLDGRLRIAAHIEEPAGISLRAACRCCDDVRRAIHKVHHRHGARLARSPAPCGEEEHRVLAHPATDSPAARTIEKDQQGKEKSAHEVIPPCSP